MPPSRQAAASTGVPGGGRRYELMLRAQTSTPPGITTCRSRSASVSQLKLTTSVPAGGGSAALVQRHRRRRAEAPLRVDRARDQRQRPERQRRRERQRRHEGRQVGRVQRRRPGDDDPVAAIAAQAQRHRGRGRGQGAAERLLALAGLDRGQAVEDADDRRPVAGRRHVDVAGDELRAPGRAAAHRARCRRRRWCGIRVAADRERQRARYAPHVTMRAARAPARSRRPAWPAIPRRCARVGS